MKNKAEDLHFRIDKLEESFDSRPSDREEMNHRNDVIQYAPILPHALGAEFLQANLGTSKRNYGSFLQALNRNGLLTSQKTSERSPRSSKTCGKLSSTTMLSCSFSGNVRRC